MANKYVYCFYADKLGISDPAKSVRIINKTFQYLKDKGTQVYFVNHDKRFYFYRIVSANELKGKTFYCGKPGGCHDKIRCEPWINELKPLCKLNSVLINMVNEQIAARLK